MQFDANLIVVARLGLFLSIGFSLLFTDFWKGVFRRIREWVTPGIQIEVSLAVHKFDAGLFLHSIILNISNTTERETRIDNITIFDKRRRELRYITRKSSLTELNIGDSETQHWYCFCHREPTGETDLVRLGLAIERTGKRTLWKIFESRLVSDGEFPAEDRFYVL